MLVCAIVDSWGTLMGRCSYDFVSNAIGANYSVSLEALWNLSKDFLLQIVLALRYIYLSQKDQDHVHWFDIMGNSFCLLWLPYIYYKYILMVSKYTRVTTLVSCSYYAITCSAPGQQL